MSAKWLGVKKVRLDTIVLPGGFAKRKKDDHVHDLAESIKRGGVISLPVIDATTRKLVAGGDRLAALQLLKVAQHEMRLVEGTPEELEAITIEENLWRRRGDDYNAMTKRLIQLVARDDASAQTQLYRAEHRMKGEGAAELQVNVTTNSEPAPVGRPKTDVGRAREEVAARLGKTPEAIRQAEKRANKKEREAEEAKIPEEQRLAEKPPVTTYGVPLSPDVARAIVEVQRFVDEADSFLRRAQGALTTLKGTNNLGAAIYSRVQADVHRAADGVRRERPDAVCPCCKLIPARVAKCTFCGGTGVVSNDKINATAPELLVGGDKAVVPDGRGGFVPYAREAAGTPEPVKKLTAKGERRLRVQDEVGNPIALPTADEDEDAPF